MIGDAAMDTITVGSTEIRPDVLRASFRRYCDYLLASSYCTTYDYAGICIDADVDHMAVAWDARIVDILCDVSAAALREFDESLNAHGQIRDAASRDLAIDYDWDGDIAPSYSDYCRAVGIDRGYSGPDADAADRNFHQWMRDSQSGPMHGGWAYSYGDPLMAGINAAIMAGEI